MTFHPTCRPPQLTEQTHVTVERGGCMDRLSVITLDSSGGFTSATTLTSDGRH